MRLAYDNSLPLEVLIDAPVGKITGGTEQKIVVEDITRVHAITGTEFVIQTAEILIAVLGRGLRSDVAVGSEIRQRHKFVEEVHGGGAETAGGNDIAGKRQPPVLRIRN